MTQVSRGDAAPSPAGALGTPGAPGAPGVRASHEDGGEAVGRGSGEPPAAPVGQVTIGVAIAVPEPHATMLREARLSYGDLQAITIPTHVTILPPTVVEADSMTQVHEHLSAVAAQTTAFRVELLGTDSFRPVSPVVFVPLIRGAGACAALASAVRTGPLARDLDFSYHPHVTIGHNIPEAQLDEAERGSRGVHIDFVAEEVVLYLRDAAHTWERAAGFPFAGPEDV